MKEARETRMDNRKIYGCEHVGTGLCLFSRMFVLFAHSFVNVLHFVSFRFILSSVVRSSEWVSVLRWRDVVVICVIRKCRCFLRSKWEICHPVKHTQTHTHRVTLERGTKKKAADAKTKSNMKFHWPSKSQKWKMNCARWVRGAHGIFMAFVSANHIRKCVCSNCLIASLPACIWLAKYALIKCTFSHHFKCEFQITYRDIFLVYHRAHCGGNFHYLFIHSIRFIVAVRCRFWFVCSCVCVSMRCFVPFVDHIAVSAVHIIVIEVYFQFYTSSRMSYVSNDLVHKQEFSGANEREWEGERSREA